jgi:hypothetical protein
MMDEQMAEVVMGALAVTYSEGTDGIEYDYHLPWAEKDALRDAYRLAEERLIRTLYEQFPHVVSKYGHLSVVKQIKTS